MKGKKGTLEHPCCTEAKTCFGKDSGEGGEGGWGWGLFESAFAAAG